MAIRSRGPRSGPVPQPGGDFSLSLGQVASGKEGRFVVPDVPTGCKYSLGAESGIDAQEPSFCFL